MRKLLLLCALAGMPLAAVAANHAPASGAQGGSGMGMKGHDMGPGAMGQGMQHPPGSPAEFLATCQGKKAGDKVTVNMPHGPMQGSCQLMFRPDRPPRTQPGDAVTPPGKGAPAPAPH
ncbi:MAG: hypothetical protein V4729_14375 [Pseudomonadota bacterium]